MLHVVLDRQEISKTILEKTFFLIFWRFYLFSVFVLLNFKIGPSQRWNFFSWNRPYRVSKNREFMLISKKQTCLSDKMPPKKVFIKKLFSNFAKSHFFSFFNYNFFGGHFVTKVILHFLNQHKILDFLIPYMTYFKKKKIHLSEGPILKFINTKTKKR